MRKRGIHVTVINLRVDVVQHGLQTLALLDLRVQLRQLGLAKIVLIAPEHFHKNGVQVARVMFHVEERRDGSLFPDTLPYLCAVFGIVAQSAGDFDVVGLGGSDEVATPSSSYELALTCMLPLA